jgi:hypothetical protein
VTATQFSCEGTLQPSLRALCELASIIAQERSRSREIKIMARPVKAVATLASLALLACSAFAVSWVGLALLGY